MRSLILSFLFVAISVSAYAQFDDCTTASGMAPFDITTWACPTTVSIDNTANTTSAWTAGMPNPPSCIFNSDNDQWYYFTALGPNMTIELSNSTNGGGFPDGHVATVFDLGPTGCTTNTDAMSLGCFESSATAGGAAASIDIVNCFVAGQNYAFVISGPGPSGGTVDLCVTHDAVAAPANDMCAMATPLTDDTGCPANTVSGTTVGATKDVEVTGCIEMNDATVWYSFTAGDDVEINATGAVDNPAVALYSSCMSTDLILCDDNGIIALYDNAAIIPGNTYYVAVAYPAGSEGAFDLCVESYFAPTNDPCSMPEDLGTLTNSVAATATLTDNFGATSSGESYMPLTGCTSGSASSVYYQFTVGGAGNSNVNILYNETDITNSNIAILQLCTDASAFMGYEWTGTTDENVCLMPGTYLIQVASCDLDEGTFSLSVTASATPSNDDCAMADLFIDPVTSTPVTDVPAICEDYNVTGTTISACPESSDLGTTCDFDLQGTVWYTFTTTAALNQLAEITLNASGATPITQGTFALFSGACGATTLVGTCQTDGTEADIVLSPSTQYFIAVSQDDLAGAAGTFDIDLIISSIPTNDDCDLATNPDILSVGNGTTNCADHDVNSCGVSDAAMDHQVFYIYSNNSGSTVDLEITIEADATNGNPATQVSITILNDDCGTFTGFYPGAATESEYCGILGMGVQTMPCIEDGETVILLFGSIEGEEGDFTISATEGGMQPVAMNDECDDILPDVTPANTCMWETINVDNNNACPEDFGNLGACNFNVDPVVWYQFTVPPAAGTYRLEIQNITDPASYLTIFNATADCDNITAAAINADCEMGAGPHGVNYDDLTPGATYLIAFGNPTPGMYSFEIKIDLLPDNDECADAEALTLGTPAINASTICATDDMNDPVTICDAVTGESSVWYSYDVISDTKTLTLSLVGLTGGGDVNIMAVDGCNSTTYYNNDNNNEVCGTGAADLVIDCPIAGTTIYFMVTTSEAQEGDYTLTLTETQTIDVTNDDCANAIDITPAMTCTDEQTTPMSNETACPENFDIGACGFDSEEVVWFSIDIPMGATTLDLGINSYAGLGTGFFALFSECSTPTQIDGMCYTTVSAGDFDLTEEFDVTTFVNTTIYLAFGSNGMTDIGGDVVFDIRIDIPPMNDECANAEVLVGAALTPGTTACATQEMPAWNGTCNDMNEENTVWYEYTVPDGDKGFHITINGAGANTFTAPIGTSVFETDACDISTLTQVGMDNCSASNAIDEQYECVGPGTYTILVYTSGDNEGDFEITITPLVQAVNNDICADAEVLTPNPQDQCIWTEYTANTLDACPEDFDFASDCGFDDFPVVWYSVTSPAESEFLDLALTNGTMPFIAVFPSTIDCDNVTAANALHANCLVGPFDMLGAGNEIPVTPNTMYLIAVGVNVVAGANVNFEIKWITPPDNDECVDAEEFDNLMPLGADEQSQTFVMETTQCATEPFAITGCPANEQDQTVWYTYEVEVGVKEITIDVANWTNTDPAGSPQFVLAVLSGCNGSPLTQVDGTSAEYCGGDGDDLISLSCINEGEVITIMVSSSAENEGTFDITLNTAQPNCMYTNDECTDAVDLGIIDMDDPADCVFTPGCNDLACTDFDFSTACPGIDVLNTVWYTFTTDDLLDVNGMPVDAAFVNLEIINGETGELDNPGAILITGTCDAPAVIGACAGTGGSGEFNSGPLGMPGQILPNTTYTVIVYNSNDMQNGGEFDLCVTVTSGCVNDDICDAFTLEPGVTVDNPASSNSCTDDFIVTMGCDNTLSEATLWYQVDVPEGASSITITLNNDPIPDGVEGEVSIAVGPLVDCNALDVTDVLYSDCTGFGTGLHEIPCAIEYGTYWIQIGSDDEMESGDFTITYDFDTNSNPLNDLCSQAEDLAITDICMFVPFDGTLKDACEELNDYDACLFSENPAVWYKITIPAGPPTVTDMDVMVTGLGSPIIGIFEYDCMAVTMANMGITGTTTTGAGDPAECIDLAGLPDMTVEGVMVTPGTEYYILVSSSTGEDVAFTMEIKLNAPPINDDPCLTSINPPLDLTGGGSHAGTTCCARGPKDFNLDGSVADWQNQDPCNPTTEDAAVWYVFTPNIDDDGYDIVVNGGSISNQMTVQVYGIPNTADLCNAAPTADDVVASSCSSLSVDLRIANCDPDLVYYVKVTTADDDCGDFDITISPAVVCDYADECPEITQTYESVTPPDCSTSETIIPIPGCLDLACPETNINSCEAADGPTVWFQINIDSPNATALTTQVDAPGFDAVWQIFEGTGCGDLTQVISQEVIDGSTVDFPCSNSDGNPANNYNTPINPFAIDNGLSYFVAVTAIGDVDDPNFTLNFSTGLGCLACSGDSDDDCENGEFSASVMENGAWVEVADDFQFCQGIDVQVCFEFIYNTTGSGNDWLHGFVPVFGPGWDVDDNILASIPPPPNFEFFSSQGPCAPVLNGYDLPNVCTYMEDGVLKLCNSSCDLSCPCSGGMESGDPLPSGFWYNTDGGSSTCGDFGCSPASFYGWPGGTDLSLEVCLELKTKTFDSVTECEENKSLQILVQTFSDAISGCWEDSNPCIVDPSLQGPAWEMECNVPPPIDGEDVEICHDGVLNILVTTSDGSPTEIQVDVVDNLFVLGENSYTFSGGSGFIVDDLLNTSTTTQVVEYIVYAVDPSLPCPGKIDTIEVTLYPELMVTFPPASVCEGDCTDITPDIIGGAGMPYTYEWGDGQTTASINVCPVVPTTYTVTVTDVLGCTGEGDVEVIVRPPVELLLPESIAVCKDDNFNPFNPDYQVCVDFLSGSSPYSVQWVTEPGLVGVSAGFSGECFSINEVASFEVGGVNSDGVYILTVNVTDFFGCMGTTTMEVSITGELTIVPTVQPYACGETEADLSVFGIDAAGNPVPTFLLYGGCPDNGLGVFLEEFNDPSGNVLFPTLNLLDYTCYTIVAQTESGCQQTITVDIPLSEGTPIQISGDDQICVGSDATISIDNESDYETFVWTPNIGDSGSITFTPDTTASYIVEATDADGCVSQEIWTVTVNELPSISLAGALQFCENGTATITASGGVSYEWTGIAGAQIGPDYTTSVPGDATVTVTDVNGCVNDSTITFTQVDVIEIILTDANICDGMGDTLFVPDNIINVSWSDGTIEVSDTTFYIISGAGSFTVTGQDEASGCDAEGAFTVEEFITPIISIPDTVEVCRLDSGVDSLCIDFTALAVGSTGTWSQDGIIPGFTLGDFPLDNACFEGIQTGCYPFTFTTNTAQAPCMDTMATMMVCVKACPCPSPATTGIPDICNLGTYNLALAELTQEPGTWTVISGPTGQDITGIITDKIFMAGGITPGDYVVRFTLDSPGGGGCDEFSEQTITVIGQDVISAIMAGQLCNISGSEFPTTLDLFDLINVDASNGGTWVQVGPETVLPITGGSMISSDGVTDFTQTFTFEYTSGDTGGPCPSTVTEVTVNIFDCTCPILIVAADTLCNDGIAIDLNSLLTNNDNLSGTWSTSGNLEGASMFNPNMLDSGPYTVTFTLDVSPGTGCPVEFSNTIIVRRQAIAVLEDPEPIGPCTADTGNGPTTANLYDYLEAGYTSGTWMQTAGDNLTFSDDGNSIAIVDFMGQDIGEQFTFEFTTQGAEDPCENITVEVVITVRDCNCPPIELADPDPICNDLGMLDLCSLTGGSDPGTFTVLNQFGIDQSTNIDVTGCIFDATQIQDGTYTIIYTLDQQVTGTCVQADTVFLEVIEFIDAILEPNPVVCNDPTGTGIQVLNFFDYITNSADGVWIDTDNSGVDLSTNLALTSVNFATGNNGGPVAEGTYTFTFIIDNAEPCEDVTIEMEVEVISDCNCPPIIPGDPDPICSTDGPLDLTQYDDPDMPGTWSSTDLTVENGTSLIIDGVAAGEYVLIYTLTTPLPDCPEFEEVTIMIGQPANPGTPAEDLHLCEGDVQVIDLDGQLTGADDGGSWTETSSTPSTGFNTNTFDTDGQVPGTYTFQYSIVQNDPCPDADVTVTIVIDPNPIADAGMADLLDCVNTSEDLGGTGTSTGDDLVYSWTLDGVEVGNTASLTGITVEGEYQLLVTNSLTGCVDSSTVLVEKSDDLPTFMISTTDITCNGDSDGILSISDQNGGDGDYTYSLNNGTAVSDPSSFTGLAAGEYTIAIIDGIGCTTEQAFTIVEPDPVSVTIAGEDIIAGQPGDEFTLTIDPVSENIDSVSWSDFNDPSIIFCTGSVEECTSITLAPTDPTTSVYVEVFDENGCTANDQVQIQLNQIVDVIFPNIISPNGDGVNDLFVIESDDVELVLNMKIFDRWGELIWTQSDFQPKDVSKAWDGKFNNRPVVPGVYVFTVDILFNDLQSTQETFSGDITVTDGE